MPNYKGNAKHLKPFKKGYDPRRTLTGASPNPIVTDIKKYIRERLSEPISEESNITKLDAIAQRMLHEAGKGNIKAIELAMAYGYGKPMQQVDVTTQGEQIQIGQIVILPPNDSTTENI